MINRCCLELDKECQKIVQKCLLKCTSLEDLNKFRWSNLMKEWKREGPIQGSKGNFNDFTGFSEETVVSQAFYRIR